MSMTANEGKPTVKTSEHPGRKADRLSPVQPRDYLILFALADGKLHGHGILKSVEEQSGGVIFDPANLYRSLRKLERNGQVAEVEERAGTDGRRRRYYRLTPLGSDVLIAEAGRLVRLADAARARNLVPDVGEAS